MIEMKYHRITDWNSTFDGTLESIEKRRMSFEAAFDLVPPKSIAIRGRLVDSNGVVVLRSMDTANSLSLPAEIYQKWDPSEDLAKIVRAVELDSEEGLPAYFASPVCELNIEIRPTVPGHNVFGVFITMSGKVSVLENYTWLDSGYIGAGLLCEGESLLNF